MIRRFDALGRYDAVVVHSGPDVPGALWLAEIADDRDSHPLSFDGDTTEAIHRATSLVARVVKKVGATEVIAPLVPRVAEAALTGARRANVPVFLWTDADPPAIATALRLLGLRGPDAARALAFRGASGLRGRLAALRPLPADALEAVPATRYGRSGFLVGIR